MPENIWYLPFYLQILKFRLVLSLTFFLFVCRSGMRSEFRAQLKIRSLIYVVMTSEWVSCIFFAIVKVSVYKEMEKKKRQGKCDQGKDEN